MKSTRILALVLVVVMSLGMLASCDWWSTDDPEETGVKQAEYNTYTSVMPSNWNELTYADNNDTQIMSYISSSFFSYDYKFENDQKFNEDGSINKEGIVSGAFTTNYSAATKLEDVTSTVDAKWGYTDEQKEKGGYAWKITLRDDLKWDDGTSITAADFVYSMKEQLNPKFMNFRANTYYDTLMLKGSRDYFYQGAPIYADVFDWDTGALASEGPYFVHFSNGWSGNGNYSVDYLVSNSYINDTPAVEDDPTTPDVDESSPAVLPVTYYKELSDLADEYGYIPVEGNEEKLSVLLNAFLACFGIGAEVAPEYYPTFYYYFTGEYGAAVDWATVGMYEVEGENAFVVCLDTSYEFLDENGDLTLWAAYYMSGLPLVKESLYESCKKEPAAGATLWTSNYNSSLATTASWGPYKLVAFEAGSHYRLEKNEHWYGWNMPENANQYNITAINCRCISEITTAWMAFLSGELDDAAISDHNVEEYYESKYGSYSKDTGTFGMQLYSNLPVLKASGNNNGILAIKEFRQALNLSLNRTELIDTIWPGTATPCFGLVNTEYYYDIENATTLADGGKYRNTNEAKSGILRAYGWTENADGTWTSGNLEGYTTDEAYAATTGYNPVLAKEKLQAAITELTTNAEKYGYDSTKDITLVYGSSIDNAKQRTRCDYLQGVVDTLVAGTALEGKIKLKFDASAGDNWAEAFREGDTQIGFGYGFSGNPFNPFNIVGSFVDPDDDLNYHMYWAADTVDMTLTMPEGEYAHAGETLTMSLQNWYYCLNGLAEVYEAPVQYDFGEGSAPAHARLAILAALEEVVIDESRSIMLIGSAGVSLLGAKFSQFSDEYHTFMGFGGIRYMEVNYTDAEWTQYVQDHNGDLSAEYKKSE